MNATFFSKFLKPAAQIETERLLIYPLLREKNIFMDLHDIYSSSSNVHLFCQPRIDFRDFVEFLTDRLNNSQEYYKVVIVFVIQLKSTGKIIGVRNFILDYRIVNDVKIEPNENNGLISEVIINKNYWKKGYAFEASTAIFNLMKKNSAKSILVFVNKNNIASKNLCKKLGFSEITLSMALEEFKYFPECTKHTANLKEEIILLKQLNIDY